MANSTGLLVRFALQREKNEYRSEIEGRDIYDEVEVVYIRTIGSRDEVSNLVTDEHRREFADDYKAWKAGQAAPLTGTPLDEWPGVSQSFIDEMRSYGVRSVEQLAALSDGIASQKPGWLTMRSRAQGWIENSANQADAAAAELAKADAAAAKAENDQLKSELAEMRKMLESLTAPKTDAAEQTAA